MMEASAADMEAMNQVLEMLREKKKRLETLRDSLKGSIAKVTTGIKGEEARDGQLHAAVGDMRKKYNELVSAKERGKVEELAKRLEELGSRRSELREEIKMQAEEKNRLMELIYAPVTEKTRRGALRFIHQALLNELSGLVSDGAASDVLLKKEQQIRMCEALENV